MIELSNTTAQTLTTGQSLTFDTVVLCSGCAESHRPNSGTVTLRATCGIYEIHFAADVTGAAAGPVQLAITLDGEPLMETTVISTVYTAGDYNNVATATLVRPGCGCCGRVAVTNTGTAVITVGANPALYVKRVA